MKSAIWKQAVARRLFAGALIAVLGLAGTGHPVPAMAQDGVPRFVSLRSNEVNVRAGPGTRYPISWVFVRQGLPVEIVAEFDNWRKIRDMDGAEGWIHQNLLSRNRFAIVIGAVRTLMRDPEPDSVPVVVAEPGVIAQVLRCREAWCRLEIAGRSGWLLRAHIWGVYPDERID